jgi:hypothetical protein
MRKFTVVILLCIVFLSGFMIGVYITSSYQNQLQVLGQNGILFPTIAGFAGVASTLKLIYDWYKGLALKFDGTTSRPVSYVRKENIMGKRYLIIVKKKGAGGTKDCTGEIKVEGIDTDYYMTLWYKEDNPSITITMDEKYLNLFEVIDIDNQKRIRFFPYQKEPVDVPYEDNINKRINVRVGSTNAQKPKDYSKKISEIINDP